MSCPCEWPDDACDGASHSPRASCHYNQPATFNRGCSVYNTQYLSWSCSFSDLETPVGLAYSSSSADTHNSLSTPDFHRLADILDKLCTMGNLTPMASKRPWQQLEPHSSSDEMPAVAEPTGHKKRRLGLKAPPSTPVNNRPASQVKKLDQSVVVAESPQVRRCPLYGVDDAYNTSLHLCKYF